MRNRTIAGTTVVHAPGHAQVASLVATSPRKLVLGSTPKKLQINSRLERHVLLSVTVFSAGLRNAAPQLNLTSALPINATHAFYTSTPSLCASMDASGNITLSEHNMQTKTMEINTCTMDIKLPPNHPRAGPPGSPKNNPNAGFFAFICWRGSLGTPKRYVAFQGEVPTRYIVSWGEALRHDISCFNYALRVKPNSR